MTSAKDEKPDTAPEPAQPPAVIAALNTDRFIIPAGPDGDRLDITRSGDEIPACRVKQVMTAAEIVGVQLDIR